MAPFTWIDKEGLKKVVYSVPTLLKNKATTLDNRMKELVSLGFSECEALQLFLKYPELLNRTVGSSNNRAKLMYVADAYQRPSLADVLR